MVLVLRRPSIDKIRICGINGKRTQVCGDAIRKSEQPYLSLDMVILSSNPAFPRKLTSCTPNLIFKGLPVVQVKAFSVHISDKNINYEKYRNGYIGSTNTLWKITKRSSIFPWRSPQMVTCLLTLVEAWFKLGSRLSAAAASFKMAATYRAWSRCCWKINFFFVILSQ